MTDHKALAEAILFDLQDYPTHGLYRRHARLPDLETAFLELWAQVQELEAAAIELRDDMMFRAEHKIDVIRGEQYRVVNAGNGAWTRFCEALPQPPETTDD